MTHIHFIGGEKGGVGKSLVARLLAQYLIDHQRPFLAFDTDRSHGAMLRFYADYTSPVVIDRFESLDAIVEAAVAEPGRSLIVDLAAQTDTPLTRWIDESDVLALAAELGLALTYWHVMDAGRDSVALLQKLLDRFGSRMNYVLVLNALRGDDFAPLEASGQKQRALDLHARVIGLRHLHDSAMGKIDHHGSSFWSATQPGEAGALSVMERQRVKLWLRQVYAELDTLAL